MLRREQSEVGSSKLLGGTMSLFQCDLCGCCENTALACQGCDGYAETFFDWTGIEDRKGKKLCSARKSIVIYILQPAPHPARARAVEALKAAPDGYAVTIKEPTRNAEQNAKFHALCSDIAKSGMEWAGKRRSMEAWKVLLVSGHAVATKEGAEVVPGLEGEFINIRESTALMSKGRSSSLIEYTVAFMATNGIAQKI